MLFNSIEFFVFLPIVFIVYWLLQNRLKIQNLFVVVASYVFYGWWDWRFLVLIALTSFLSWVTGLYIDKGSRRKLWLFLNITVNLLILCCFKYFNFFIGSFCDLFNISNTFVLKVILPVGISFYTFQAISYSIDVYRGKIKPTKDVVAFFAYVCFFPQLVAGPIERATNLLPQFEKQRHFNYAEAIDGCRRILWGFFKKVVIADNCAKYVDLIWADYSNQPGSSLALAAILFTFQIYGDFSGYSDIAIGTAKLFGVNIMDNFLTPYFSRNVAEFWKRWHISLNTWFVDYVYIPLGGSRNGKYCTIRNTFIIFLLSGLWHGANWTYVVWGLYHALLFVPLIALNRTKSYSGIATFKQIPQIVLTFIFVSIGWIIFRAPTISDAWSYLVGLARLGTLNVVWRFFTDQQIIHLNYSIIFLILVEWLSRSYKYGLGVVSLVQNHWIRIAVYYLICFLCILLSGENETFIYFQF